MGYDNPLFIASVYHLVATLDFLHEKATACMEFLLKKENLPTLREWENDFNAARYQYGAVVGWLLSGSALSKAIVANLNACFKSGKMATAMQVLNLKHIATAMETGELDAPASALQIIDHLIRVENRDVCGFVPFFGSVCGVQSMGGYSYSSPKAMMERFERMMPHTSPFYGVAHRLLRTVCNAVVRHIITHSAFHEEHPIPRDGTVMFMNYPSSPPDEAFLATLQERIRVYNETVENNYARYPGDELRDMRIELNAEAQLLVFAPL